MDYAIAVWEAILRGDERAINIALWSVLIFTLWRVGVYIANRVAGRITAVEEAQADLRKEVRSMRESMLKDYVTQDQLDKRMDGIKGMIGKLTDAVTAANAKTGDAIAGLQTKVAVMISHFGIGDSTIVGPAKRKAPTKRRTK